MPEFVLKYGQTVQRLTVPAESLVGVVAPRPVPAPAPGEVLVQEALARPVGGPPLAERVRPGQKVVILASDITRPTPTATLLPPLLAELQRAGVARRDVAVVFGLGIHRRHTSAEQARLLGPVAGEVAALDSDPAQAVMLGRTSRGTPVAVFRPVAEADVRICTGTVEYHYFAGYSGGVKAILPGVCTRATIEHNHALMVDPQAVAGEIDQNPVRQDLEEVQRFAPADYLVNVVLNDQRQIVRAVAGDPHLAFRQAAAWVDELNGCPLEGLADVVIASAGGSPKDLNLYQAQKALDNARLAVRPGGVIILVAKCPEGFGEPTFEEWMRSAGRPEDLITRLRQRFVLGGHKAAAIALTLQRAAVFLVSALPAALVRQCFFEPYATVQQALAAALERVGPGASVLVMPQAGSTLPRPARPT